MASPLEYAQQNADQFRNELHELLTIPSVGTDPAFDADVERAAQWVAGQLRSIGLETEIIQTDRHPLVYAEWMDAGENAKTLLIYGHYDVQPASIEDGWDTEPFEPVEKDGKLYARGATDDKGQLFIHIKAVESYLKTTGSLPLNIKFLIEGEEESGGESIEKYVAENQEKLSADICVISDGSMRAIDQPAIVYALRGALAMNLRISGPGNDLHSGMFGGTVHNPIQALVETLGKLHNDDGSVAVPGFYDDVVEIDDDERTEIAKSDLGEEEWREATGAPHPWGEADFTLRERIGARPTLEFNGIAGGYFGDGHKMVIPQKAVAKLSCRLVAHQDPKKIFDQINEYLAQIIPDTVHWELSYTNGAFPSQVDIKDPAMRAAENALLKGWGAKPIFLREGGSLPIVGDFQSQLNLPVILMGFGLPTDNLHGPNEHLTISMFHKGIETSIYFYDECAKLA